MGSLQEEYRMGTFSSFMSFEVGKSRDVNK